MTERPKIKTIIFDLGGVVAHGGYLPFLKHYCFKCFTPDGKKTIEELEHRVNLGEISERQFYQEIARLFDVHLTPEQMHKIIVSQMSTNDELLELIPKIKKAKVALFSNSIGSIAAEVLKKDGLGRRKIFDRIFLSNKIHLAKPDKKAYEFVIKSMKVRPSEALLVDDRAGNIEKAKKIGMHGLVYKDIAQFKKALSKYEFV